MAPADLRTLSILIFIISLLVEHCDFDRLRTEHTGMFSYDLRFTWRLIGSRSLGRPGHGFQGEIPRCETPLRQLKQS